MDTLPQDVVQSMLAKQTAEKPAHAFAVLESLIKNGDLVFKSGQRKTYIEALLINRVARVTMEELGITITPYKPDEPGTIDGKRDALLKNVPTGYQAIELGPIYQTNAVPTGLDNEPGPFYQKPETSLATGSLRGALLGHHQFAQLREIALRENILREKESKVGAVTEKTAPAKSHVGKTVASLTEDSPRLA
jgi:hypothetical protein